MEAVAAAIAIPLILFVFMLDDLLKTWQNGKVKVEEQKTLGELSRERQESERTRQEELKLERAQLERNARTS